MNTRGGYNMQDDKLTISVQIPLFVYNSLKKAAKEECTTVSYLVRRLLIKSINEEGKING